MGRPDTRRRTHATLTPNIDRHHRRVLRRLGRVRARGWDGSASPTGWRTSTLHPAPLTQYSRIRVCRRAVELSARLARRSARGRVISASFGRVSAGSLLRGSPPRSSSDSPPQIPYGSRVRRACRRHSSRTEAKADCPRLVDPSLLLMASFARGVEEYLHIHAPDMWRPTASSILRRRGGGFHQSVVPTEFTK